MEFDNDNVIQVEEEDRLSSLPDELLHKILSSFDINFVVQTCLLSSRWKLLWTSTPFLNFSIWQFAKFMTNFLPHRNHQIDVSSVKLHFNGSADQRFVKKIANYIFTHNVQELSVSSWAKKYKEFPHCLFSSQSLKHFTLSNGHLYSAPCVTPTTPWDFPSLTPLHLSDIALCDDNTVESVDLFSKCVNLKDLTLKRFFVKAIDIITPRLSTLMLIECRRSFVINLIAPQLENLTVINCKIKYLNAPPGLSSLYYRGYLPQQLSKERFHSLNKVSICLVMYRSLKLRRYKEKDALKTINMLQELHSVRYLTLNVDIVECLSSYPDLLLHHPSPFSNLSCLTIDSSMRDDDAYKVKMSRKARNFFLENSPNATFIMELTEASPTKAMKQKEASAKNAKQAAEIANHAKELRALIDNENMEVERRLKNKKAIEALEKLRDKMDVELKMGHSETRRLLTEFKICVEEMRSLVKKEEAQVEAIVSKEGFIRSFLEDLPYGERTLAEKQYFLLLENAEAQRVHLRAENVRTKSFSTIERFISFVLHEKRLHRRLKTKFLI